jgi:ribosomal 50S subunit-recycling heat shock protein
MRIDKFLKVSRLVKRRTVANELCDAGRVLANGRVIKAGYEVKAGDQLTLVYANREISVTVLRVPEKAVSVQEADTLYQLNTPEA